MFLCCVLGWVNLHVSSLRAVCHAQQFYSFPGYNSHWFSEPGNLGAHLSCARPESWGFQCGEQAPLPLGKSFIFLDPSWLWISPLFLSVYFFLWDHISSSPTCLDAALLVFVVEALFILFSEEIILDVVVDWLWEEKRTPCAAILKCSLQPFWIVILMLDISESDFFLLIFYETFFNLMEMISKMLFPPNHSFSPAIKACS